MGLDMWLKNSDGYDEIYWWKANQIFRFIDEYLEAEGEYGVENCKDHAISRIAIEDLLDICHRINKDHSLAEELLPGQEGFFFGSTEPDMYYFQQLEETERELKDLLQRRDEDYFIFHAWW